MGKRNYLFGVLEKCYSAALRLLKTPFFYFIGKTFSHGGVHFAFLVITFILITYLWQNNNNEDIKPHNIALDVSWTNKYHAYTKKGDKDLRDSIKNLKIHFELNSKATEEITNGNYHNRLILEFDGEGPLKKQKFKNIDSCFVVYNENKNDSIQITLYGDPLLSDIKYEIVPDSIIRPDSIPAVTMECYDQETVDAWKSDRLVFIESSENTQESDNTSSPFVMSEPVVLFEQKYNWMKIEIPDTTKHIHHFENGDSTFILKLLPSKYKIDKVVRSPNQKVTIYSDALGVKKNDPYYYYFISIPSDNMAGNLVLDFKVSDLVQNNVNLNYTNDKYLQYEYVFPVPDRINNGYIEYHTKEKMDQIVRNHGVVIQAVDINALNKSNNNAFLYSVLVGTGLAFILDIIVQLIREIRNLNRNFRKNNKV